MKHLLLLEIETDLPRKAFLNASKLRAKVSVDGFFKDLRIVGVTVKTLGRRKVKA